MLRIDRKILLVLLSVFAISFAGCEDDKGMNEAVDADGLGSEFPADPPMDSSGFMAETVYFAFDSDVLSMDAQNKLGALADHLRSNSASLQIEGHCDERGSTQYNLALGERRAQSVKQYLVQLGIDSSRITTISYGEEKPSIEGHDESAWSQNRRSEFTVSG
mgnify:CR=1 FL=1